MHILTVISSEKRAKKNLKFQPSYMRGIALIVYSTCQLFVCAEAAEKEM